MGAVIAIRAAVPGEFAAVGDICAAAYAPFLADTEHDYAATLRDVAARAAAAEVLVAADAQRVLGTVTFVPDGGPLGEIARPGETEFRMLAVDPAAQGHGIGATLTEHVLEASRRRGAAGVVCSSLPGMHGAHRIYERLGFRREPARDWSPVPGVELIALSIRF